MHSWAENLEEKNFVAHATAVERAIRVSLTGTADLAVRSKLDRFLHEVHSEAQRRRAEEVTVDVRGLESMNSACLKCFTGWVSLVQEQPGQDRYRVVFVSSLSVFWQRRSLNALACLAKEIVSIQ